MTVVKHDYYEVLGVDPDASGDEIRSAFYEAAWDCRPEGDSWTAEERFRELSEAYDVLSRPGSRVLYDRHGYRGRRNGSSNGVSSELEEGPAFGEDVSEDIVLRWFESVDGTARVVQYQAEETCPDCGGHGAAAEPDPGCPACGGTGRLRQSGGGFGDLCPLCSPDPCATCEGTGRIDVARELRVQIPAGIETGDQLRVAGEGNAGPWGGEPGDLLLDVIVQPEPSEPRLVRYVALALFVVAVVILVVYLR